MTNAPRTVEAGARAQDGPLGTENQAAAAGRPEQPLG